MAMMRRTDHESPANAAARQLAELVLSMDLRTSKGLVARRVACTVLDMADASRGPASIPLTTNGTTRMVQVNEPLFLIRGQDKIGADVVRYWADLAESRGASADIVAAARTQAARMEAWPIKKTPDLPSREGRFGADQS
jgi:hypothetical protein